jgi:hypothetical protein
MDWIYKKPKTKYIKVATYKEIWICPKCDEGEMEDSGESWYLIKGYQHKCSRCSYEAARHDQKYPSIVVKEEQ